MSLLSLAFDPDPTSIIRIYRSTLQRVKGSYSQLSSRASFVIYSDRLSKVTVWHGSQSDMKDRAAAVELAKELRRENPAPGGSVTVVTEENENPEELSEVLELLWSNKSVYFSETAKQSRNTKLSNSPKRLNILIKDETSGRWTMKDVWSEHPTSKGNVPKMSVTSLYSPTTCFVLEVGGQWDLWVGDDVSDEDFADIKTYIDSLAHVKASSSTITSSSSTASSEETATATATVTATDGSTTPRPPTTPPTTTAVPLQLPIGVVFGEPVRVVKQWYERASFRGHFFFDWRLGSKLELHELADELNAASQDEHEKNCVMDSFTPNMHRACVDPLQAAWSLLASPFTTMTTTSTSTTTNTSNNNGNNSGNGKDNEDDFSATTAATTTAAATTSTSAAATALLTVEDFTVRYPVLSKADTAALRTSLSASPYGLVGWQVFIAGLGVAVVLGVQADIRLQRDGSRYGYSIRMSAHPEDRHTRAVVINTQEVVEMFGQSVDGAGGGEGGEGGYGSGSVDTEGVGGGSSAGAAVRVGVSRSNSSGGEEGGGEGEGGGGGGAGGVLSHNSTSPSPSPVSVPIPAPANTPALLTSRDEHEDDGRGSAPRTLVDVELDEYRSAEAGRAAVRAASKLSEALSAAIDAVAAASTVAGLIVHKRSESFTHGSGHGTSGGGGGGGGGVGGTKVYSFQPLRKIF